MRGFRQLWRRMRTHVVATVLFWGIFLLANAASGPTQPPVRCAHSQHTLPSSELAHNGPVEVRTPEPTTALFPVKAPANNTAERSARKQERQENTRWWLVALAGLFFPGIAAALKKTKPWVQIVTALVVILIGVAMIIGSQLAPAASFNGNTSSWILAFLTPFGIAIAAVGFVILGLKIFALIRERRRKKKREAELKKLEEQQKRQEKGQPEPKPAPKPTPKPVPRQNPTPSTPERKPATPTRGTPPPGEEATPLPNAPSESPPPVDRENANPDTSPNSPSP